MNNNILIVNSIPEEFMVKSLGCGCNAECFLTKYGVVFKMMNDLGEDYDTILKNSKYDSEVFMFPKMLVFLNNYSKENYAGYLMKYANGDNLRNMSNDINILKYINSIKRVEEEIAKYSLYKIDLVDIGCTNIIYTKDDEMKIVDTDFYRHNSKEKNLYAKNFFNLSISTLMPFMDISNFDFKSDKLRKYLFKLLESRMLPSDFLYEVINTSESIGLNINTVGELKKEMKLL